MPKPKRDPELEKAAQALRKADGVALGMRLRAARTSAGETLESVARKMTDAGIPVGKAAVGHWETGHSLPDALQIRRLAKIYDTTTDALLWDDALSMDAIRFAVQFDALSESNRRKFAAMWLAYFEEAKSDEEVAQHLPAAPGPARFAEERRSVPDRQLDATARSTKKEGKPAAEGQRRPRRKE
jgi:transcriptional regulator with XRE-family HTH domain